MDLRSIGKLLQSICVNYPTFKKDAVAENGNIRQSYADEWLKRIGFMDYEEADAILEDWLMGENSKFAPKPSDFLKSKEARDFKPEKKNYVQDNSQHTFHIGDHGELLDEEEREYGGVDENGEAYIYHYNKEGRICRWGYGTEIVIA